MRSHFRKFLDDQDLGITGLKVGRIGKNTDETMSLAEDSWEIMQAKI